MKIQNLLLLMAVAMANPLYATGLTDVIEKQPLAERLLTGEGGTVAWPVMSSPASGLTDFKIVPTKIKVKSETTSKNTSTTTFSAKALPAKEAGPETGQIVADKTGEHPVGFEISATKQTYGVTSTLQHVHVFVGIPGESTDKEAVLYYKRPDGIYEGWGLHLFNNENCKAFGQPDTDWNQPWMPESITESYGALFRIPLSDTDSNTTSNTKDCLNIIVHNGDEKDFGGDLIWNFSETDGPLAYIYSGYNLFSKTPLDGPPLTIDGAGAHWVSAATLLWNEGDGSDVDKTDLLYSADASITLSPEGLSGNYQKITLAKGGTINPGVREKFPHLMQRSPLAVSATTEVIREALKGQLLAVAYKGDQPKYATRVQIQGVLDELYQYDGELGAMVGGSGIKFKLWAPTAQKVRLAIRPADDEATEYHDMNENSAGVWVFKTDNKARYNRSFYRYEVTVFHPQTGNIENYEVTDPYSLSLSTNSRYSQAVDLNDADLKPDGWKQVSFNTLAPEDMVLYESHIRDFSVNTAGVDAAKAGKFAGFTDNNATAHLKQLQSAGLTHVHLLPAFDFASVNEDPADRVDISQTLAVLCAREEVMADADYFSTFCQPAMLSETISVYLQSLDPGTEKAQYLYKHIRPIDSFNWGYDPFHYTAPEGSYASTAEGPARIKEFREMVKSLKAGGMGVVMDVVYNHTHAHGISDQSVLDKIVPWYYQRLNPDTGMVENSTCCSNTASEFHMMEKLMIDSMKVWVKDYKVDAFRFDLMGHHMKRNIEKALAAVKGINPDIYFYGEGWEFGEVAGNGRGVNANQVNMAGTGVGTFTDRMRDKVRGGSPFDEGDAIRQSQGYASGLYYHPNETRVAPVTEAESALCAHADIIRLGMAANLKNFRFVDCHGTLRYGMDYEYNGVPAGYSLDPQEVVNYVSKHDNQTLWDILMYKLPKGMPTANRVKLHNLALGITLLSQGVPFIHAGSERLRSKSMERDSYDSGDWFNRMPDSDNNYWNQGLPREDKDGKNWNLIKTIIADETTRPDPSAIALADANFQRLLKIRKSSPLLRLKTEQDVIDRITYLNTGPNQVPGLIIQRISDEAPFENIDPAYEVIIIAINPSVEAINFPVSESGTFILHPELRADCQAIASMTESQLTVPALSIVVFVKESSEGVSNPGLAVVDF